MALLKRENRYPNRKCSEPNRNVFSIVSSWGIDGKVIVTGVIDWRSETNNTKKMKGKIRKLNQPEDGLTIEKLKELADCSNYTDEELEEILQTLKTFALLCYNFYKQNGTEIHNQNKAA